MKTNMLHQFLSISAQCSALAFALTCGPTLAQAGPLLQAVGPETHEHSDRVSCGYLEVYSRTQEKEWGEGSYYYPHTPYWIYNTDGKRIRTVGNNSDSIDESPEKVALTPGTYTVKAWSDDDGLVTVPVIVKLAQTTSVHLESGADSDEIPAGQVKVGTMKLTKSHEAATQEKVASQN